MRLDTWTIHGEAFHFGRRGLGQEETNITFSSDSLFASLAARLARSGGPAAVEEFAARFLGDAPPVVFSSTFPLAGSVRFFPAPARSAAPESEGVSAKHLKRVSYLSEGLFRKVLAGNSLAALYAGAVKLQSGSMLVEQAEVAGLPEAQRLDLDAPLWVIEQRPRVTLERASAQSSIFFTGRLVFARNCGLWFGVHFRDGGQMKPRLESLLLDLAEAGLGAERSTGFGACQIEPGQSLELPGKGNGNWITLSRYLPREDEIGALAHPDAAYTLRAVGGWVDSPARAGQRRRPLNLLAEGSVFGPLRREVPGQVADVRPVYPSDPDPLGHPVYRCGLALALAYPGGG